MLCWLNLSWFTYIMNDCNAFKTSIIIYELKLHSPQMLESSDIPSSSHSQLQIIYVAVHTSYVTRKLTEFRYISWKRPSLWGLPATRVRQCVVQKKFTAFGRKILLPSLMTTMRTSNTGDIFMPDCKAIPSYLQDNGMEHELTLKKSLAQLGRKKATATKLGNYSTYSPQSSIHFLACCSNFCKPLKKNSEGRPTNQVSGAAVTSA